MARISGGLVLAWPRLKHPFKGLLGVGVGGSRPGSFQRLCWWKMLCRQSPSESTVGAGKRGQRLPGAPTPALGWDRLMARDGPNRAEPPDRSSWGCRKPAAREAGSGGLVLGKRGPGRGKKAARPQGRGGDWARAAWGMREGGRRGTHWPLQSQHRSQRWWGASSKRQSRGVGSRAESAGPRESGGAWQAAPGHVCSPRWSSPP